MLSRWLAEPGPLGTIFLLELTERSLQGPGPCVNEPGRKADRVRKDGQRWSGDRES